VLALRRTAKVVRFRALAIFSALLALKTSSRSSLSRSGVQGRRGVPVISPSPLGCSFGNGWLRSCASSSERSRLLSFLNSTGPAIDCPPRASRGGRMDEGQSFPLRLQPSCRPKIGAVQTGDPHTKSPDLLKRVMAVLPRWKLPSGHQ
jgi:hypothetical protein